MKIKLTSVMVDDQEKALQFYTTKLGFIKKKDIPMGEARWLTVVSPELPGEVELLLEPMGIEAAKVFQQALFNAGIPATAFQVDNIQKEYERLEKSGVKFISKPVSAGPAMMTSFDDTCGNLIQIYQV